MLRSFEAALAGSAGVRNIREQRITTLHVGAAAIRDAIAVIVRRIASSLASEDSLHSGQQRGATLIG